MLSSDFLFDFLPCSIFTETIENQILGIMDLRLTKALPREVSLFWTFLGFLEDSPRSGENHAQGLVLSSMCF